MDLCFSEKLYFFVYNYKPKAMRSSRYPNLLDNLEIEDPDVINCLIDQVIVKLNHGS
ncbi:hypothetical protein HPB52_011906 [Rhipicephalus sanguineus]|uniref:Uncharacterized protein n=1 Tax=Rhipicephalus sanguineus TaxID=34632 RepID=A0A9D4QFR0_RHISA|nr:hypothetical protein HPB52_011906 [Rhipicephalus sanguineus]